MPIIRTENLTKKFKNLVAVSGVNLSVETGECLGLLGPNGAGKTSLIRMITGVSPATDGEIWVDGKNFKQASHQIKAELGVVPQLDNLDPDLSVLQNLLTFARYFEIPKQEAFERSMEILRFFQLEDKVKSKIKELSGGMKRRLLIARGLINQPKILILDEPTSGLDPQTRHVVWQKLKELRARRVTQLLCTQNMEEAAVLCDRVAVMHVGKILAVDAPAELISRYIGDKMWEVELTPQESEAIIRELEERHIQFEVTGNVIKVFHLEDSELGARLGRPRTPTLEDVFFRLTGGKLVE